MKKIYGLMSLATAMVFASCSSDAPDGPDGDVITSDMTKAYANIRIMAPSAASSRAAGDGDNQYEYGEDGENIVKDYLLLFYDAQGNNVGVSTSGVDEEVKSNSANNVALLRTGVAKITLNEGANMPTQMLAVINSTSTLNEKLLGISLSEANKLLIGSNTIDNAAFGNVTSTWGISSANDHNFIMSNSVYYDDITPVSSTTINEGFIFASEEDAKKAENQSKTVDAYVERIASKARLKLGATGEGANITPLIYKGYDGETEYKLEFESTHWDVTATANITYFIKQLLSLEEYSEYDANGTYNANNFLDWMNAYNDFRSYWAESYFALQTSLTQDNYPVVGFPKNDQTHSEEIAKYKLNYKTTKDVESDANKFEATVKYRYLAENTIHSSRLVTLKENPYTATSAFVLNGKYKVSTASDNQVTDKFNAAFYLRSYTDYEDSDPTKPFTNYYILTEKEAIMQMLKTQDIFAFDENGSAEVNDGNIDKFELVHLDEYYDVTGQSRPNPANRMTVQIKSDATGIFIPNTSAAQDSDPKWTVSGVNIATLNESLAKMAGTVMMYNGQKAYFYIPIKHFTANMASEDQTSACPVIKETKEVWNIKTGNFGVVRNHVYDLTVNSITGLGIGVGNNPDNVPELPDPTPVQNYYINAKLNVLQWHVMGQSVDL